MLQLLSKSNQELFYATSCSAGFDIRASDTLEIPAGQFRSVPTGLYIVDHTSHVEVSYGSRSLMAVPELQIRPRSGLAAKFGVTVLNAPGTIDADYRGEIQILLINHSKQCFTIHRGDRIAQGVCGLVFHLPGIEIKSEIRGEGGFGSTGHS